MLKEKELSVLRILRKNSRRSMSDIHRSTGIPVSTLFEILHRLENRVITRHTILVDFPDFKVRANFFISAKGKDMVSGFLRESPYVNNLFSVAGEFDLFAQCYFPDSQSMDVFEKRLDGLGAARKTLFTLEEVKREGFMG